MQDERLVQLCRVLAALYLMVAAAPLG